MSFLLAPNSRTKPPGPRPQNDIQQTIDLVKTLKPYQSIVVPLLFTPMETTRLGYAEPLLKKDLSPKHHELISVCWNHNLDWFPALWANYGRDNSFFIKMMIQLLLKFGEKPIRKRVHQNAIKRGANIDSISAPILQSTMVKAK